ncbi:hypothetical protein [Bacillus sp. B1-b2]|uniref:hypothetical protein n=1 Tax=Bacillus sp. B1-b2 TaxID=2653201 RepID=UPI001D034039|nr:hypothetical protein [Bacillus sp. B1-b2]
MPPITLTDSLGFTLPPIFGIGTSLPLLFFLFMIWAFGAEGSLLKKGKKFGNRGSESGGSNYYSDWFV